MTLDALTLYLGYHLFGQSSERERLHCCNMLIICSEIIIDCDPTIATTTTTVRMRDLLWRMCLSNKNGMIDNFQWTIVLHCFFVILKVIFVIIVIVGFKYCCCCRCQHFRCCCYLEPLRSHNQGIINNNKMTLSHNNQQKDMGKRHQRWLIVDFSVSLFTTCCGINE